MVGSASARAGSPTVMSRRAKRITFAHLGPQMKGGQLTPKLSYKRVKSEPAEEPRTIRAPLVSRKDC
jgi:hypothetical protein